MTETENEGIIVSATGIGRPDGRKTALPLTDSQVRAAIRRGVRMRRVSDNLYIDGKCGAWRLMWKRRGQLRRKLTLGYYPDMSLDRARDAARAAMSKIVAGRPPGVTEVHTLQTLAPHYLPKLEAETRPGVYRAHLSRLRRFVYPLIGNTPLTSLTIDDTKAVLDPLWDTVPRTGKATQALVKNLLVYAKVSGWCTSETVDLWRWEDTLDVLYPSASKLAEADREKRPSIHWEEIRQFWLDLLTYPRPAKPPARRTRLTGRPKQELPPLAYACLKLLILTGTRVNETIGLRAKDDPNNQGAKWTEFDFQKRLWTIPKERMKEGVEHIIPLNDVMLEVLAEIKALTANTDSAYVFRLADGARLSYDHLQGAMQQVMADTREYRDPDSDKLAVLHGFRASAGTWGEEHGFPEKLVDACLAHGNKSATTAAYQRSDQRSPRSQFYTGWATFLMSGVEDRYSETASDRPA